ncbi:MAG: hypothetical protein AAF074_26010 [Pseudomonadota bacterium]
MRKIAVFSGIALVIALLFGSGQGGFLTSSGKKIAVTTGKTNDLNAGLRGDKPAGSRRSVGGNSGDSTNYAFIDAVAKKLGLEEHVSR